MLLWWVTANRITLTITKCLQYFHHLIFTKQPNAAVTGSHETGSTGHETVLSESKSFSPYMLNPTQCLTFYKCCLHIQPWKSGRNGPVRNVHQFLADHIASHPRRHASLCLFFFRRCVFLFLYCAVIASGTGKVSADPAVPIPCGSGLNPDVKNNKHSWAFEYYSVLCYEIGNLANNYGEHPLPPPSPIYLRHWFCLHWW